MIVDAFFSFVRVIVSAIAAVLPDWEPIDLDGPVGTVVAGVPDLVWQVLGWFNNFLPVAEVGALVGVLLGVWVGAHAVKAVEWFLTKLHIAGGSA